jgi:hypothetical protein
MKLYLETSVPNMLFSRQSKEKQEITERLFAQIQRGLHEAFVSAIYLEEVEKTSSPLLRYQLEGIVKVYGAKILRVKERERKVADAYVDATAFTEQNYMDALHVAAAVCGGCDVVVSWNYRHIARAWTIKKVGEVNHRLGLAEVAICNPEEVIGDEDDY